MLSLKAAGLIVGVWSLAWALLAGRAHAYGWAATYILCGLIGIWIFIYRHREGN